MLKKLDEILKEFIFESSWLKKVGWYNKFDKNI